MRGRHHLAPANVEDSYDSAHVSGLLYLGKPGIISKLSAMKGSNYPQFRIGRNTQSRRKDRIGSESSVYGLRGLLQARFDSVSDFSYYDTRP